MATFSTFALPTVPGTVKITPYRAATPIQGEPKNQAPFTTPAGQSKTPGVGPLDPAIATAIEAHNASATSTPKGGTSGGTGTPGSTTGQSIYDLSTDPIVQRIRAINSSNYGQAVADADAARKQLLISAGFGDLATAAQFGSLEHPVTGDAATAAAAKANPYSTAAQLALANTQALQGIDTNANKANLYYSSTRANQMGDQAHTYLGNVSSAEDQVRQQLTQIVSSLLSTRQAEQQAEADAIEQARQNAINNALASGMSFLGYDSNGNPIFGNPDKSSTSGYGTGQPMNVVPAPPPPGLVIPVGPAAGYASNVPGSPLDQARRTAQRGVYV